MKLRLPLRLKLSLLRLSFLLLWWGPTSFWNSRYARFEQPVKHQKKTPGNTHKLYQSIIKPPLRIFPHLKFHHIFKFKTLPPSWTNKFSKKPGNSILRSHHLFTDFHPLPLAMAKYGKAGATIHWPPGGISKGPWKNTTCRVKSAKQLTVDSSPFPKKTKNIRNKKIKQVKTPTSECFGFFTASWWSKRVWFISWMYKDCFSFETTFQNIVATFCITYQSLLAQRWQPDFSIHHGCCRLKSLSYLLGLHGSRKNPRVLMKSL